MFLIRPTKKEDLDKIEQCALTAGIGLTHLPRQRDLLEKKIQNSLLSFAKQDNFLEQEEYLFVLENTQDQSIGGTCGIYSKVGAQHPFYVYHIEKFSPPPRRFPLPKEMRLLRLSQHESGSSEACGLYLLPEYRHSGLGRLLSLSRFLFIASFQKRFMSTILANMRGIIEKNISPFWEGLGRHFLDMEYQEVLALRSINEAFLPEVLPKHPIYVTLLSPAAQQAIGKMHSNTIPAANLLEKEGFQFANEIDPLDGGPILRGEVRNLRIVKSHRQGIIKEISAQPIFSEQLILCNNREDFRVCYGTLAIGPDQQVIVEAKIAEALELQRGDLIRYVEAREVS